MKKKIKREVIDMEYKYNYILRIYFDGNYDDIIEVEADYDEAACEIAEEFFTEDRPEAEIDFVQIIYKHENPHNDCLEHTIVTAPNVIKFVLDTSYIRCENPYYETAVKLIGTNEWRIIARYETRNMALNSHLNYWTKEIEKGMTAFYDIDDGKIYAVIKED